VIGLACPADRIIAEVRIEEVDPAHAEPVADALQILEADLPTRGAVGLAEGAHPAELIGDAADLLQRSEVSELGVRTFGVLIHEAIDPGYVLPGVEAHHVRAVPDLGPAVLPNVPCGRDPSLFAGLEVGFCEVIQKEG